MTHHVSTRATLGSVALVIAMPCASAQSIAPASTLTVARTSPGGPPELIEFADTVTDMTPVKHVYTAGIGGQGGIEW